VTEPAPSHVYICSKHAKCNYPQQERSMSCYSEIKYLQVNDQDHTKHDRITVLGRVQDRRPTRLNPNPLPGYEIAEIIPADGGRQSQPLFAKSSEWPELSLDKQKSPGPGPGLFLFYLCAPLLTRSWVLRCLSSLGSLISSIPCFSLASLSSIATSSGSSKVREKLPQNNSR